MGSPFSKKPNPSLGGGGGGDSGSGSSGASSGSSGASSGSSGASSGSSHGRTTADISNSSSSSNNKRMEYIKELRTYESDCQRDPELQSFDATLEQRTIGVISILASSEANSMSFDTLRQVTGSLLDNSQQVVKMILEHKQDIWNNPELFALVNEYFENSLQTLDFCTALEKCLKKARESQLIIHVMLKQFEEEDELSEEEEEEETGGRDGKKKYKRTLEELQHFKDAGDPFTQEFFQMFQLVYRRQVSMLEKLMQKKKKLDKKLKSVKTWRKVSNIIFVSAFAALLVSAVVAAVLAAPPVAAALAAASAIPLGSVGKWVNSLWKGYSDVLKGERDVLSTMQVGTYVTIAELDSIRLLVDRLEIEIGSLLQNVDFASRDEEGVKFGIEEIQKKLGEFMKGVEDLGKQVDRCSRYVQRARTVVLQRIIKHPK